MNKLTESKIGGFCLIAGTVLFLISVFFEYRIGWISMEGGPENAYDFVKANWSSLKSIWYWQMIGGVLVLLSYFLFYKLSRGIHSAVWVVLIISSLMSTAAFLLTLGSYQPALEVYDTSPELFESIRGGISSLYKNFQIGPFLFMFLFCYEAFTKNGIIIKRLGLVSIGFFVIVLGIGLAFGISAKIAGLSYFILPLVFGYSYIVKK